MTPADVAARSPDKPAYIMAATGVTVSFAALEAAANQAAHLFRELGLQRGDHIAILLENHERFYHIAWAAQRAGLYYTAISWRLQQEEVEYIVNNCEAKVFVTSAARREVVEPLLETAPDLTARFMLDGTIPGFNSWEEATDRQPTTPIEDQAEGAAMLYSSGTTGFPKGIKRALPEVAYGEGEPLSMLGGLYGASEDSIYLSPAPLYHAAPLRIHHGLPAHRLHRRGHGSTSTPSCARVIETLPRHPQPVGADHVRAHAEAPEEDRAASTSSCCVAIHAAAPCPDPGQATDDRLVGPGHLRILRRHRGQRFRAAELARVARHEGSVGRPLNCELHILRRRRQERPVGEAGTIYFGGGVQLRVSQRAEKTADSPTEGLVDARRRRLRRRRRLPLPHRPQGHS